MVFLVYLLSIPSPLSIPLNFFLPGSHTPLLYTCRTLNPPTGDAVDRPEDEEEDHGSASRSITHRKPEQPLHTHSANRATWKPAGLSRTARSVSLNFTESVCEVAWVAVTPSKLHTIERKTYPEAPEPTSRRTYCPNFPGGNNHPSQTIMCRQYFAIYEWCQCEEDAGHSECAGRMRNECPGVSFETVHMHCFCRTHATTSWWSEEKTRRKQNKKNRSTRSSQTSSLSFEKPVLQKKNPWYRLSCCGFGR